MIRQSSQVLSLALAAALAAGPVSAQGICPEVGDLAPGTLDESTMPPTWLIDPDGLIGVGDVVALLRASVGLQQLASAPLDTYIIVPGITSGATFLSATERDCPTALTLPMSVSVITTDDPPGGGPLSTFILERYSVTFRNMTQGGADVPGVDVPQPFDVTTAGVVGSGGMFPDTYDIAEGPILPHSAKSQPPLNDDAFYTIGTDPLSGVVLEATIVWWGHPIGQPSIESQGTMVYRFTIFDVEDGSASEMDICAAEMDC